jgi:AcrR family transcriptional regulator
MMTDTVQLSTKEKILDCALTLFSEQGYDAASVAQIAEAVGIKAPSLYKHFKSKQEIFTALLGVMKNRYDVLEKSMHLNGTDALKDASMYEHMPEDELILIGKRLFSFFLHDSYMSRFWKMLTIEQFKNKALAQLYIQQYIDSSFEYLKTLFTALSAAEKIHITDPETTAVQFYAPIFMLLSLCYADPSREQDSLDRLEKHITQFLQLYA